MFFFGGKTKIEVAANSLIFGKLADQKKNCSPKNKAYCVVGPQTIACRLCQWKQTGTVFHIVFFSEIFFRKSSDTNAGFPSPLS